MVFGVPVDLPADLRRPQPDAVVLEQRRHRRVLAPVERQLQPGVLRPHRITRRPRPLRPPPRRRRSPHRPAQGNLFSASTTASPPTSATTRPRHSPPGPSRPQPENTSFRQPSLGRNDGQDHAHIGWARDLADALEPHTAGAYVNFIGDTGADRVRAAYPPAIYDRLASVKRRYDPDNIFRLNQNIPPADK